MENRNGEPNGDGGAEPNAELTEIFQLPVLPLRGMVVFPHVQAPIAAGRKRTVAAIRKALKEERLLFAVAQRDESVEVPTQEQLYRVGTVVRITQMQKVPGGIQLVVQGDTRAAVLDYFEGEDHVEVKVRPLPDMDPIDSENAAFRALHKEVKERAREVSRLKGVPQEIVEHLLGGASKPAELADVVAFHAEMETHRKQALLELLEVEARLLELLKDLQQQVGLLEAQEEIREQVREELGERQREVFLREQMKTIQKELGEDIDLMETNELREKIEALDLPKEARREVSRELRRLDRIPREAAEAQVVRTYLETFAELPWNETTEAQLDMDFAERTLERDHYGLKDVKERILDFLAVRKLKEERKGDSGEAEDDGGEEASGSENANTEEPGPRNEDPVGETLLFIGPPGVGKTSIARSIAEAMGRKYVRVSLGGARDEADIRGHRRTYVGAMAGRIIEGLKRAGTRNPVFLLDEIDKLGVSFQGDPSAALMEVLDPAQNSAFVDHYLGVPFDLSDVLFIATANFIHQIPGPLLDRMETIEFRGYTEAEKLEIAKRYLLPRQIRKNGLTEDQIDVTDEAVRTIVVSYTREAGVRNLERELGTVCRKTARKVASGEEAVRLDTPDMRGILGQPKVYAPRKLNENGVGVATGLFYTPAGGDIMLVETSLFGRKDALVLTGQLGDVMKESAQAALTFARRKAKVLELKEERLRDHELHIHVPAGAIPKEGPSAGIAMAVAVVSALGDHLVRHDVAMTGEITLSGRVLAIGGVKEKVLGALRAGMREVILPADNAGDIDELPDHVREQLTFHPVSSLSEALSVALVGVSPNGTS